MTEVPAAVTLRGVKKMFPLENGRTLDALDIEHWSVPAGSCTVLTGPSGSGKTTLLNLIAGVASPSAGTIHVGDTDVFALSEARRDRFRAGQVGYVFQTFNLLAAFSALENVTLAMMFAEAVPKRLQRRQFACPDVCRGSPRHSHSMLSRLHKHTAPVQTDVPVAALATRWGRWSIDSTAMDTR